MGAGGDASWARPAGAAPGRDRMTWRRAEQRSVRPDSCRLRAPQPLRWALGPGASAASTGAGAAAAAAVGCWACWACETPARGLYLRFA